MNFLPLTEVGAEPNYYRHFQASYIMLCGVFPPTTVGKNSHLLLGFGTTSPTDAVCPNRRAIVID